MTSWTNPKSRNASASSARPSGRGHGATEIEACSGTTREPLPERLGDERHHRVQQAKGDVERLRHDGPGDIAAGQVAVEPWLDLLDVPVGEVAPDEAVDRGRGLVQPEALVRLGRLAHRDLAARDDPPVGQGELVAPHDVLRGSPRGVAAGRPGWTG